MSVIELLYMCLLSEADQPNIHVDWTTEHMLAELRNICMHQAHMISLGARNPNWVNRDALVHGNLNVTAFHVHCKIILRRLLSVSVHVYVIN